MEQTGITLLLLTAGIVPLLWGAAMHSLVSRLWPVKPVTPRKPHTKVRPPVDYQI